MDRNRIDEARDELMSIINDPQMSEAVLVVFANKQDLPDAMPVTEITKRLELHLLTNRNWYIQSTCAHTGSGLYEGLDWVCKELNKR